MQATARENIAVQKHGPSMHEKLDGVITHHSNTHVKRCREVKLAKYGGSGVGVVLAHFYLKILYWRTEYFVSVGNNNSRETKLTFAPGAPRQGADLSVRTTSSTRAT